ncbi:hypothetical protein MRX96_047428, partial [Rhipicephalus microplus]
SSAPARRWGSCHPDYHGRAVPSILGYAIGTPVAFPGSPTSSHRRSASVACTRVLWNLISSAKAVRLHHEQAQKLCRVVSEKPTSLRLPVLAADVETTARGLTSSAASSPTTSTTASSTAVAAHHTAQLEDAGSILCVNVTVPQNVPLPSDEEPDIADMDTTSTHAVTHATDEISQSEFQTVLSKSKKRRQRASTSQGPAAHTGPRPATESTAMLAHVAPGTSNAPTATQTAPAGVRATEHTMPASASSSLDSGTILFRPANASASFHRTSRLAIAQALSALSGVKEVRVNTKKNIVAADASTPEWMNRLLATSELAGIPVTARLPADRSQSSGVVQGVDGDYTDEALLAAVSSDVPVIAARRQGTSLVLRFASPVPPTRVRLFRMVFEPAVSGLCSGLVSVFPPAHTTHQLNPPGRIGCPFCGWCKHSSFQQRLSMVAPASVPGALQFLPALHLATFGGWLLNAPCSHASLRISFLAWWNFWWSYGVTVGELRTRFNVNDNLASPFCTTSGPDLCGDDIFLLDNAPLANPFAAKPFVLFGLRQLLSQADASL